MPKKSILKKPRPYNAAQLARMRNVVVRLDRLDLSQFKFCMNYPKTVLLVEESSSDSEIPTLRFCRECAGSFDCIFEGQRKEFVAPYESALQMELARNEVVTKQLKIVEKTWYDEAKKQAELANQLDQLHDKYNNMFQIHQTLRKIASDHYDRTIMPEHCYAKNSL